VIDDIAVVVYDRPRRQPLRAAELGQVLPAGADYVHERSALPVRGKDQLVPGHALPSFSGWTLSAACGAASARRGSIARVGRRGPGSLFGRPQERHRPAGKPPS